MNTQCQYYQAQLGMFLNHHLPKDEKIKLKKHLNNCKACRLALQEENQIRAELKRLPVFSCPDELTDSIMQATVGKKSKKAFRQVFGLPDHFTWKGAAVGVAVACVLLLVIVKPFQQKPMVVEHRTYTQEELLKARKQARWSLTYVAQVIDKSENLAVDEVIMKELPQTLQKVMKKTVPILKGEDK